MKKSSFFIILAIAICLVTLTAANFKLKQEYTSGNYGHSSIKKTLPAFSYVKDNIKHDDEFTVGCEIMISNGNESMLVFDTTQGHLPLDFTVKNDTLFITANEKLSKEELPGYFFTQVFTKDLQSLSASRADFTLSNIGGDSLAISASSNAGINLSGLSVKKLNVFADKHGMVELIDPKDIPSLQLTLRDKGSFKIGHANDSTSINLAGKSTSH